MIIKGKLLIGVAIGAIALFLIASPLGDAHHGMGRHNKQRPILSIPPRALRSDTRFMRGENQA